ncbi:MAG: substrate-binding domain-containing protein [Treponema sp.]|jgi:ABC-type sugar transport system substrate-binding protein|nr:substrate-binding domain-containing protein [Treponema sp.]
MKYAKCFLTVSLVFVAALLLLIACQGKKVQNGDAAQSIGTTTEAFNTGWSGPLREELPRRKIGVMYYTFTDKLGTQMKNAISYLAEGFNIEPVFYEFPLGTEGVLATVEGALQSDIDGIIAVACTPAIIDVCKNNGNVPFVTIQTEPINDEQAKEMAAYDNYLGAVSEDDYQTAYNAIQALYNAGARNFGVCGVTKGMLRSHDLRAEAALNFIREHPDAKLIADDYSSNFAQAIESWAATYPELDGLFTTAASEQILQTIQTNGLTGKVKYASIDISPSAGEFFQSGDLTWIAGGQYGTTMIGFAILYNYLADGTRIIPDTSKTLLRPFLYVGSYQDYETYVKYVDSGIPVYSVGEVGNMIHAFNPEVDFNYFKHLADVYSIADIEARHKDIIQ